MLGKKKNCCPIQITYSGKKKKKLPNLAWICFQTRAGWQPCEEKKNLCPPHLVRHDHDPPVAERLEVVGRQVLPLVLQPEDLDQLVDLLVLHDLLVGGLADVQQLAPGV